MLRRKPKDTGGRRPSMQSPASSSVFSYYSNRSTREGDTTRQYHETANRDRVLNRQWVKNLPSLIVLAAIGIILLYCLSLTTTPQVLLSSPNNVVTPLRDKQAYQDGAQRILNGSLMNRTKLTINTDAFVKELIKEFPEISDASVTLPLVSRRPIVAIDTAQPALLLTANGKAYALDARGKAIIPASELNSSVRKELPVVNDNTGLNISEGKAVLPTDDVSFITAVIAQLKAKQVAVKGVILPSLAQEMHVQLEGEPYYVKFNFATDPRVAVGTFLATKAKLDQDRIKPAEYIDVRIEERAYYK